MKVFGKRLTLAVLMALAALTFGSRQSVVLAQAQAQGPETEDPVKVETYNRFYNNNKTNKAVAYKAAQDYLLKYKKDKDQYIDYLQKWVAAYESDERREALPGLINQKNFSEAFATGAKILAEDPNNLRVQIDLGYAGYLAASAKNEQFNATALDYARKAIQQIEAGKAPAEWAPFKGKDDTLAYLHYAVGFMTLKTDPSQAIDSLLKAAQLESDIKKTPSTYYFLAVAYEAGPYKTLSSDYQAKFANKPETPESKAALEKLNVVMDRIIDAYARAIAAAGTDPKTQQNRTDWTAKLLTYYKFRHEGSDAGMNEFIAAALQKPLPPKP
jgi:tetratricopeptide (TPR) repeat protein